MPRASVAVSTSLTARPLILQLTVGQSLASSEKKESNRGKHWNEKES